MNARDLPGNRAPEICVVFNRNGDFQALYAAQEWLSSHGVSYGSLCGDEPVGLLYGNWAICKWRNLTPTEQKQLDGRMEGDFRHGPVTIRLSAKSKGLAVKQETHHEYA